MSVIFRFIILIACAYAGSHVAGSQFAALPDAEIAASIEAASH
jgi:hypothetical protein